MTDQTANELHYVLPGDWLSLDLSGGQADVERRIKSMVQGAVGGRDDQAQARHDLRQRLKSMAEQARTVKASRVHFARTLLGPIPLPVTLTISQPGAAVPHRGNIVEAAQQLLPLVPGDDPTVVEHSELAAVRTTTRHLPTPEGGEACLVVNYWVASPGKTRLTIFTFSTPVIALEDALITFFDAMMLNVRIQQTQPQPA